MRNCIDFDPTELEAALTDLDSAYNPAERMLRHPFGSPGYHTQHAGEWVHGTRVAGEYALALCDSGDADRLSRAVGIIDRLLSLQDTNPDSNTYGIWSWFLEEPLPDMAPPDWNWADFIGTYLIQIAMDHGDRLPPDTADRLDQGALHAARSIIRRDVGPAYTNIALMGTHVTFCVGEHYRDDEVLAYARARLRRFVEHTREHGAFSEYNSPTYTSLAARIIARMGRDIEDEAAQPLVSWLYDLVWGDIAQHFHPPTRQWSGPHSRNYSTLLGTRELAFFQRALGGNVRLMDGPLAPDPRPPASRPAARRSTSSTSSPFMSRARSSRSTAKARRPSSAQPTSTTRSRSPASTEATSGTSSAPSSATGTAPIHLRSRSRSSTMAMITHPRASSPSSPGLMSSPPSSSPPMAATRT